MVAGVTAENRKTIPDDSIIFGSIEKQHSLLKKKKLASRNWCKFESNWTLQALFLYPCQLLLPVNFAECLLHA